MLETDKLKEAMTISEMAYLILTEANEPLHYKSIFAKISQVKEVKNPSSVQSCIYSRNDFIRMGDGYWGLAEWLIDGLSFIYELDYQDCQRQTLEVKTDYQFYFPIQEVVTEIEFETKAKTYLCSSRGRQTIMADKLHADFELQPGSKLIIEVLDINNFKYSLDDFNISPSELDLTEQNKLLIDLAFEVLKEEEGIMSSARLLRRILIKLFKAKQRKFKLELDPLPPISKLLATDPRFVESLSGIFTLDI
ncbi:HTH domain-containing protein [Fuchsiella alkaliacetigena]|uniref:HTH domain-containing protein n=1 Tax=Fuchsiella alkaliacetigena TaxID=957042 RepID=UPI00200B44DB|nr:HTH domain-containing protein [Fuchsiella alkaliacetigena]MCK8823857.1 winged helix-turn-helix domain-containing protein [Fuchsiella alkaliacetigena]